MEDFKNQRLRDLIMVCLQAKFLDGQLQIFMLELDIILVRIGRRLKLYNLMEINKMQR
jgi:hypothetical protein